MDKQEARQRFEATFSDDKAKAAAFDKIAETCYFRNFGSCYMLKVDADGEETDLPEISEMLFELYFQAIYNKKPTDINAYSDGEIAKLLGISIEKVLKIKDKVWEKYFESSKDWWKEPFLALVNDAVYEPNRVKLKVPERMLYRSLLSQATEGTLKPYKQSNSLSLKPIDFIALEMKALNYNSKNDREKLVRKLLEKIQENEEIKELFETKEAKQSKSRSDSSDWKTIVSKIIAYTGAVKNIVDIITSLMQFRK